MIIGLTMGSFTGDDTYLGNNIFNCINHLVEKPFMFYHILGAFIIVFVLLNSLWLKKQLSTGIATSIGKLSFSMYLVHPLIIASLSSITFLFLYRYLPYNVAALAVLLFTIIVLFVSSYLMYRYVDEPGTQLSKKIYEQYFSGEPKSIDWKSFENRIIIFTQKNIIIMIIVELVLVLSIGSMVFIAKPIMDNNRALQAETYYDESITSTIIAYNNLTAYPRFNNTSLGSYRAWLDGYEVRAINFSSNYYGMKQMSELNKQYYSLELQEKTDNDLFFYGNLVNESMNKTQQYEAYYATWYWDNTSNYSLTIPEGN
jgi:hypothetical protein